MPIETQWRSLFDQARLQENEDGIPADDYNSEDSDDEATPITEDDSTIGDDFGFGDTGDEDFPEVK